MSKYYTKKRRNIKGKNKKSITKKSKSFKKKTLKKSKYSKKAGSAKRPLTDTILYQSEKIQRQDNTEFQENIDDNLLVDTTNRAINIESAIPQSDLDKLIGLGFEDAELEMFFSEFGNKTNELIEKYLDISKNYPGYETLEQVINSEYIIPNTEPELTKHDIAEQVLASYYQ